MNRNTIVTFLTVIILSACASPLPSATATPMITPSETATLIPTVTPSPTVTPTATATPVALPQEWLGTFNQPGFGEYPMALYIEAINGKSFDGKLDWEVCCKSVTKLKGEYIQDFGDESEQFRWNHIKDFDENNNGIWIKFTEIEFIKKGNAILGVTYYAHIQEDGTMVGVGFLSAELAQKYSMEEYAGEFILTLTP